MSVSVKQVLDTLLSIGVIASTEIKQPIKPGHGPCCTCQTSLIADVSPRWALLHLTCLGERLRYGRLSDGNYE